MLVSKTPTRAALQVPFSTLLFFFPREYKAQVSIEHDRERPQKGSRERERAHDRSPRGHPSVAFFAAAQDRVILYYIILNTALTWPGLDLSTPDTS
jgi:hypothetical protein